MMRMKAGLAERTQAIIVEERVEQKRKVLVLRVLQAKDASSTY